MDFLLNFHLTDAGNGETFVALYGNQYLFAKEETSWFRWKGVRWREDNEKAKEDMVKSFRLRNELSLRVQDLERRKAIQRWTTSSESKKKR